MLSPLVRAALFLIFALFAARSFGGRFDGDERIQIEILGGHREGSSPFQAWQFHKIDAQGVDVARGRPVGELLASDVSSGKTYWDCGKTEEASVEAAPRKMWFFRPLPSLTLMLDHKLFGPRPFWYHAQTCFWFWIAFEAIAATLVRAFQGRPRGREIVICALFLFLLDPSHLEVLVRFAARHLTMSTAFGFSALAVHLRWRQEHWKPGLWISLGLWLLALFSSENALQIYAYLIAYELVSTRQTERRWAGLVPSVGIVAAYLTFYVLAGFGANGDGYVDIAHHPQAALRELPTRLVALWLECFITPSTSIWHPQGPFSLTLLEMNGSWGAGPMALVLVVGASLAFAACLWVALRHLDPGTRRTIGWLSLGSILSLLVVVVGQPGPRLLFIPSIASAVSASIVLVVARDRLLERSLTKNVLGEQSLVKRVASPFILASLAIVALRFVSAPVALWNRLEMYRQADWEDWTLPPASSNCSASIQAPPGTEVVALTAPSYWMPAQFPELNRVLAEGACITGGRFSYLSAARAPHVLKRTATNAFELGVVASPDSEAYTAPMTPCGATAPYKASLDSGIEVSVIEASSEGNIRKIGVSSRRSMNDPSLWFVAWERGALRRVTLPDVGQEIAIPFAK